MDTYQYHRPTSLAEALEARRQEPEARWLAGGTDLMVQLRSGRAGTPPALISLRHIPELKGIEDGERLRIGAAVTLGELALNETVGQRFPALLEAIAAVGSRQIRNVATLAGNLCNASPGADTAQALLVYGASLEVSGTDGQREIALEDFFTGPGATKLQSGELVSAILLPNPPSHARATFRRKARVAMDIATVSVAAYVEIENGCITKVRASAGSVAPTPLRLTAVEELLMGQAPSQELLQSIKTLASESVSPITDIRASEGYRRRLTGVLLQRSFEALFDMQTAKGCTR
ncbi:MAG: xanthine dehydrogenase family protein subunit M [bacterium]|nr:xanthine dehydrogenase family protein subunit M [bacterium]